MVNRYAKALCVGDGGWMRFWGDSLLLYGRYGYFYRFLKKAAPKTFWFGAVKCIDVEEIRDEPWGLETGLFIIFLPSECVF